MFFIHELEKVLSLHPSFFGANMRDHLIRSLLEQVEGYCTGRFYIICVMECTNISSGRIIPGNGIAEFTMRYKALVWKPFKGETVRFRLSSDRVGWLLGRKGKCLTGAMETTGWGWTNIDGAVG